ncbi:CDP-glycerol glycerophosphotransferase family protein [Spirochaeta isovalerica]|uniref:Glycosyl/glycerophosphate transferase, teichoic acid biosynthesis n=1 Tax=Spirochaeta isovalerica TaxID=150 RepID=A0A841RAJ7_9SPIO|nr:CDP-glycerol glycerophosphotransferase family protein [Spirochaeta isovalerica]MBB6480746.1 hypothetical protein [Spirochaeta isovalerica]
MSKLKKIFDKYTLLLLTIGTFSVNSDFYFICMPLIVNLVLKIKYMRRNKFINLGKSGLLLNSYSADNLNYSRYYLLQRRIDKLTYKYFIPFLFVTAITSCFIEKNNNLINLTYIIELFKLLNIVFLTVIGLIQFPLLEYYRSQLLKISKKFRKEYKPDYILFSAGSSATAYQLKQWETILERINEKYNVVVIAYSKSLLDYCRSLKVPSIFIGDTGKLHSYMLGFDREDGTNPIKAVFYINNGVFNASSLVLRKFKHIHLNHGDSDKAANALHTSKDYDYIFIAGNAALERYKKAGWDLSKIHQVGRPQLKELTEMSKKDSGEEKKIIFYAPTYEGHRNSDCYSSLYRMGFKIVSDIIESNEFILYFKAHPYTGEYAQNFRIEMKKIKRLISINSQSGHRYFDKDEKLYPHLSKASLLIGDVSSVSVDFLSTGKPLVATNPFNVDPENESISKAVPFWKGAIMLNYNNNNFNVIDTIRHAFENPNPFASDIAKHYFGENVFHLSNIEDNFISVLENLDVDDHETSYDIKNYIPRENIIFAHGKS